MQKLAAEELQTLLDALQRLLTDHSSESRVRALMETQQRFDQELWQQLSGMGVTGLLAAEDYGGAGATPVEIERVMELCGATLVSAPLLCSAFMSVAALQAIDDEAALSDLVPALADGSRIATLLISCAENQWSPQAGLQATQNDGQWQVDGAVNMVLQARNADLWLAPAVTDQGAALFAIDAGTNGTTTAPLPSFDHTLALDRVELSAAPARLLGKTGDAEPAVHAAIDIGLIALAGEQSGGAQRMLDMTVEYANVRHQFGRPIGSFQAIKHMAADLVLEVESAISAARHAAAQANREDAAQWRHLAAFTCADAFSRTTADAVQMHGGIAFTWEHPAHLYLRRARADAQLLGHSDQHRESYLQSLGA